MRSVPRRVEVIVLVAPERTPTSPQCSTRTDTNPRIQGDRVVLANCPFHALAREHTALVCSMNLHLITALLDELGRRDVQTGLDPAPQRCCVTLTAAAG